MKKIFYKLIFPPIWVLILFALIMAVGMSVAISSGMANTVINYVIYAFSFYALCIICAYLIKNGKRSYINARESLYKTKLGNKYFMDIEFRTRLRLHISLLINMGNVALNILFGFIFVTNWFFVLAFYYATLTAMRMLLALYVKKRELGFDMLGEWRRARLCGAILTLINISLSGAVLMMMYMNKGFTYEGMLIYVMAAYSFYHITVAVIQIFKRSKRKSPIIDSIKAVKLAAALVSMLSLETAMLSSFGAEMSDLSKRIFIASTGAGICIIVLGLSSYLIIKSTNEIEKLRREK